MDKRIVFVSHLDSTKFKAHHTALYQQLCMFKNNFEDINIIDNTLTPLNELTKINAFFYKKIFGKNYQRLRQKWLYKNTARKTDKILNRIASDLIFAPGSLDIAYLQSDIPKIIWTDATFNNLVNYYPQYCNLPDSNIKNGNILEKKGLENANHIIFTSDWAKDDAINTYGIDKNKISVIPFGALPIKEFTKIEIDKVLKQRNLAKPQLLFIGVDWERKGGNIILETLRILKSRNIFPELHIIGVNPIIPPDLHENIVLHGFLNRKIADDNLKINEIMLNSILYFMPSQAEALGLVFIEANSALLPVIAKNTGGVSSIVKNGINGYLIEDNNPRSYAEAITKAINSREQYLQFCKDAYGYYRENLKSDIIEKRFISKINSITALSSTKPA